MTDQPCTACPRDVRDLFACAHNAVVEYRAAPPDMKRLGRKLAELGESVDRFRPAVDAHFADESHSHPSPTRPPDPAAVRVRDLVPGDLVREPATGMSATLLGWSTPHPRYPELALVLWRMHHADGFSVDALSPDQVVGELVPRGDDERLAALTGALPYPAGA